MLKSRAIVVLTLAILVCALPSRADERQHGGHHTGLPIEVGQGAFAAIAEIIAMLEADPETDWTKVKVSALRDHLVDMNALTLDAMVTEEPLDDGLLMIVMGEGKTFQAIHRMVPAHAAELDKMPAWSASAAANPDGAVLSVTSPDEAIQTRIRALGFFGLMATGSHHQDHHLAIANGEPSHGHR